MTAKIARLLAARLIALAHEMSASGGVAAEVWARECEAIGKELAQHNQSEAPGSV